jgi:hypothetical protein
MIGSSIWLVSSSLKSGFVTKVGSFKESSLIFYFQLNLNNINSIVLRYIVNITDSIDVFGESKYRRLMSCRSLIPCRLFIGLVILKISNN